MVVVKSEGAMMAKITTLQMALNRVDARRAEIESHILNDLEFEMIVDPPPVGEMETVHHFPGDDDPEGTANDSPFTTVVFN